MDSTVAERPPESASDKRRTASPGSARPATPLELRLFLHALRLAWVARRIRGATPLVRVLEELNRVPFLPRQVQPRSAVRAATRACVRMRRWLGGLDTCLVRAMVAGSLLSDRDGVVLHLGLLPPYTDADDAAGHAWLSVHGQIVEVTGDHSSRYPEIHRIEIRRGNPG